MHDGRPMLDAHIVKRRRDFTVEARIRLAAGESVALFGASGAGKSTVLSCIAGVEQPDGGSIQLGTSTLHPPPVPLHRRRIGYLTQRSLLFPHLTVEGNVRFGSPGADDGWLQEIRERFGLAEIWRASACDISGGQAQRVAFARMVAPRPALVLLDEPFAGLDRIVARSFIASLLAWQGEHRCAAIIVDHQENVLRKLCPRVIVMERGRVIQEGAWDEIDRLPASRTLEQLLAPL